MGNVSYAHVRHLIAHTGLNVLILKVKRVSTYHFWFNNT